MACANAYYNHGPALAPPNYYYGHYGHPVAPIAPPVAPVAPVAPLYNHLTGVAPYVPKTVAQPIVNPFPTASRHGINVNHLNHLNHGYYQHSGAYGAHSLSATSAPTSSYLPPPVIAPPTVTYNNNVIPPSVQNVNHQTPPANYQPHPINYQHRPYAPVYSHAHMYNHVNYGW